MIFGRRTQAQSLVEVLSLLLFISIFLFGSIGFFSTSANKIKETRNQYNERKSQRLEMMKEMHQR